LAGDPFTLTESFTVNIHDPCPSATITAADLNDIYTFIGAPKLTVALPQATDSVTALYGAARGMTELCGPLTSIIEPTNLKNQNLGYSLVNGETLEVTSNPPSVETAFEL